MRRAIIAMVVVALAQSGGARADGSPPWVRRAMKIVARIHVPERADLSVLDKRIPAQDGVGFLVGFNGQAVYLVTAGHVIWPDGLPDSEKVALDMWLPDCDASLPGVADSARASPLKELDMALVKLELTDDVRARCRNVAADLRDLPRHIVDPDGNSLSENTRAWLLGRGVVFEGADAQPITFKKYDKNALQFSEPAFTEGDSGSPVFSEAGHILGMAIKKEGGVATRFSLILTKLDKDWGIPTNLAGSYARLSFGDRYSGTPVSIDGAPDVALKQPHPAPLGLVLLKLQLDDTRQVTDTVNIEGADMHCDVTTSRWLARHRRTAVYTTLGLVAVTGVAFALASASQRSFEQAPARTSYDRVGVFNAITIGTGSASLASLGATVVGYFSSDTTAITCREGTR